MAEARQRLLLLGDRAEGRPAGLRKAEDTAVLARIPSVLAGIPPALLQCTLGPEAADTAGIAAARIPLVCSTV